MNGGMNQSISAGPGGFLAFFLLALALWLLMRSMSKRLRRVRFEEEAEDTRRLAEAGDDVTVRPSRRQIFLPVRDDAPDGPVGTSTACGSGTDSAGPSAAARG